MLLNDPSFYKRVNEDPTEHNQARAFLLHHEVTGSGTDIGDDLQLFNKLVFTSGRQSVTPFLSGAPTPEKKSWIRLCG